MKMDAATNAQRTIRAKREKEFFKNIFPTSLCVILEELLYLTLKVRDVARTTR